MVNMEGAALTTSQSTVPRALEVQEEQKQEDVKIVEEHTPTPVHDVVQA